VVILLHPPDASSLLSAAAALDAADRALLDLWCVRRLTDDRLEAMSGVGADRLRARRERIFTRLAELQDLDADQVSEALTALAGMTPVATAPASGLLLGPAAARMAARRPGLHLGPAAARLGNPPSPAGAPAPSTPDHARRPARPARRRHRRAVGGAVAAVCLAIGIAAFASQRADARSASMHSVSAGALRAHRTAPARPHI